MWRGRLIVIGGQTTRGSALNTVEVVDCTGEKGSPVIVTQSLPKMNQRRFMHQTLIIDERYLFVFFGMKSTVSLNNTIEYMDLNAKHKTFTIAMIKGDVGYGHLFDRALYFVRTVGNL